MRFDTTLHETQAHTFVRRFIAIAEPEVLERKFRWIDRELAENPYMEEWLHEYHGTEMRLQRLLTAMTDSGGFPPGIQDRALYDLYSFTSGLVHIFDRLSVKGRRRLKGMLFDGLNTDKGLASVKHEVTTAVHLMRRGFDVEFNDLENGGVDYIARRDGIEIEVECKVFTGDLGRQIHKRPAINLQNLLLPQLHQIYLTARKGIVVRLVLPGRLSANREQAQSIVQEVSRAVLRGELRTHTKQCDIEVLDFEIGSSPFNVDHPDQLSRDAIVNYLAKLLGLPRLNPQMVISYHPKERAVVGLIESAKRDEVLKGMKHQLRSAAKGQFTRTRPGFIVADVLGMTAAEMEGLFRLEKSEPLEPTGLRVMTSNFLQNEDRMHIHTVAYRGHGHIVHDPCTGVTSEQGISYFIRNHHNAFYKDERYRIFE